MDPIQNININKDSSFAMLLEAQRRNWTLFYMEIGDLFMRDGRSFGSMREIQVTRDPNNWFAMQSPAQEQALGSLDILLMRKDPPFDQEYIYATYILESAEADGTFVVNKPASLRDANEKMFTAWFPDCCPATLVSRKSSQIRRFLEEQKQIIVKPLDGMGGASVFHLGPNDPNISVILETITEHEHRFVMAQKYIPEIREGDKRILLINGKAVPYCVARIPAKGETRGNLAAGGHAEIRPMSKRDFWIVEQIASKLVDKGLIFVGIDVIGDYLTEINVTSPTCIQELDAACDLNISAQLMDHIETSL